jgi:hypothetical protein
MQYDRISFSPGGDDDLHGVSSSFDPVSTSLLSARGSEEMVGVGAIVDPKRIKTGHHYALVEQCDVAI